MSLAVMDDNLSIIEIDIFHAQAQAFGKTQAGAVDQVQDHAVDAARISQDLPDLTPGEDRRQVPGAVGALEAVDPARRIFQNPGIEKNNRLKGLILCRRGHFAIDGQVGQVTGHVLFAQFFRMGFVMEQDIAIYPGTVGLYRPWTIIKAGHHLGGLVQEPGFALIFRIHGQNDI